MANQPINLGTAPLGEDGDTVRAAFEKVNSNTSELYSTKADSSSLGSAAFTDSSDYATAAQGVDAREWTAETVSQAEAEAGTATTRRAWTAERVRQAIVAWWNGVSSAWGRRFVASADAPSGRTALGLGNAATRAVQTSPTDTTAMALMAVGAFGNGQLLDLRSTVFEIGTPSDVFSKGTVSGLARGGPDGLNIPAITDSNVLGVLSVYGHWMDISGQAGSGSREFLTTTGRKFLQTQARDSWNQWREVFTTGNILGTVSQSGGVPTGAIIERGANANGEYVKYADGTQICTNRVIINQVTPPGGKQNNSLIPAASFVGEPVIYRNLDFYNEANAGFPYLYTFGASLGRFVNSGQPGTYDFSWPPVIGGFTANSELHTLIAIGRWY